MRFTLSRLCAVLLATAVALPALAVITASPAAAQPADPGNVVVVRLGDGTGTLSNAAAPVFLDEFGPSGSLVRTTPLPTAAAGANQALTISGTATTEGALQLSADGRYLVLAGYSAAPGTAAVGSTTAAATPRVVARVDAGGTIDSSTALTDAHSGGSIRAATSADGSGFWTGGASGGVRYATLGATTSTQVTAAPGNLRTVGIAAGQLYASSASAPFVGVSAVGTGLPTTSGQTSRLLAASAGPNAFTLLDRSPAVPGPDTLYVADDSGDPNGGIVKFSSDGTTWTARGNFRPAGAGTRGITGSVAADGSAGLVATTTANSLVRVTDTAAFDAPIAATSAPLATGLANTVLRGVAFAPGGVVTPPEAPQITTQPQDATITAGATATLTAAATGNPTYQWYRGLTGDTSTPVATGASFTTPPLFADTSYWVRATNATGSADSRTAVVTVTAAPPACSTTPVTIGSVQGTTDVSPVAGQTRTVRGTVVGDYEGPQPALRGFYLQDAGDGDPATSDGLFVFDNGANLVALGDVVEVTGPVSEFQGQTQIAAPTGGVTGCGSTATVTPVDVTLPRATPQDLEPFEGMLVRMRQTLTVTEHFQLGRFGQVVVSSGGKLRQPTADIRATDQAAVAAAQNANNLNRLIIDDATQAQNPDPIVFGRGGQPLTAANTLRGGDTVTDPVGVLTYTWAGNAASGNAYRLRPFGALGGATTFEPANPRPTAPPEIGTGDVRVASANLLNLFNTFTGCTFGVGGAIADCRGADNTAEYERQLAKEVESITFLDADVVGYMEVENDGYGPGSAVQALVDALNARDGAGAWAFVDPDAATGVLNSAGTDAIKSGLLYRTDAVTPVPGAVFANRLDLFERSPVAATFATASGARVTVVSNHFKSKGGCPASGPDADQGDGQSCFNPRRTAQATELARWLDATVIPAAGDPDVLIVGDLNSYAGEDPIAILADAGYVDLVTQFGETRPYSYVFDGQWGYLDYVMASASLRPQVTGAGDAHHNADEPSVLDYNTEFKTPGQVASLYAPDRFRTSDHDPVLAGLVLTVPASTTTLTADPSVVATGAPVTLTASVAGPVPPTGAVTFTDGATTLATVPVTDGTASAVVNTLPPGTRSIVATYSGGPGLAGSASDPVTVEVVDPAALSGTLPDGTVGVAYSAPVPYAGGRPATFAVTAGALPAGLVLSVDGTVSGTPTTAGSSTFTVTATNAVSTASRAYTITVAQAVTAVTVTSSRNPSPLLAPVTFTATVSGAGSGGVVTFTVRGIPIGSPVPVVDGSATSRPVFILPPGDSVVTATYSGTADALGSRGTVTQAVLLPAVFLGSPPDGRVGVAYRFNFLAAPSVQFAVTAGTLPAGLTLSPTGTLSGTPTARGTSTFTVRASNAISGTDRSFTVRMR